MKRKFWPRGVMCLIIASIVTTCAFAANERTKATNNADSKHLFSLDPSQITQIRFQNGNTGAQNIFTGSVLISEIVDNLNSFEYTDVQTVDADGWSYRLTLSFSSGKENGFYITDNTITMNNKRYISSEESLSAVISTLSEYTEMPFEDVRLDDWYYNDISYVYAAGLMTGTTEEKFSPKLSITRGMLVTILYRLEGEPKIIGNSKFSDVVSGSYYEKAVVWAADSDIVNGCGNGNFAPNNVVTREQIVTIIYRYAQYRGINTDSNSSEISDYSDVAEISEYALPAVKWAIGSGLIRGNGKQIDPCGELSRSQAAAIVHRFCETIL